MATPVKQGNQDTTGRRRPPSRTLPELLPGIGLGARRRDRAPPDPQWHNMLTDYGGGSAPVYSPTVQSLEDNSLWDGLFHASTWVFVRVIPEFLPVIAPLDDVVVVVIALRYAARHVPREAVEDAWPGERRILNRLLGDARTD